jgi:dihydropteroate synthase
VLDLAHATLAGVPVGGAAPVVVIGALNVSPESFYAGSVHRHPDDLVTAALRMVEAGAALIDVGARSTAPYGTSGLPEAEETDRLARAVAALAARVPAPISADTCRAGPARAALEAGARVINDVGALRDPALAALVAEHDAGLILMASPEPSGAPAAGAGGDPVARVRELLGAALGRARAAGIPDERVVLDPGIGFFRGEAVRWDRWDVAVLAGLPALAALGRPLCVGVSRKSFLGEITGRADPAERLAASLGAAALAVLGGAAAIRAHDVGPTLDAVRVAERVRRAARS